MERSHALAKQVSNKTAKRVILCTTYMYMYVVCVAFFSLFPSL